jgi:hypothetical protein
MTQNTQTTAERIETWQRVERMMDSMLVVEHSEPYPHEDGTMGGEYSDYVYDEDHKFRNLIAAEIDTLTRERDEARAEVERLRPAAEAWRQVFELQAKYSTHWRLNDEAYWLARFMEEVGELAGALVGNHVGPVEWELSQLAAIALNWLDMRAARAQAAKEAKP